MRDITKKQLYDKQRFEKLYASNKERLLANSKRWREEQKKDPLKWAKYQESKRKQRERYFAKKFKTVEERKEHQRQEAARWRANNPLKIKQISARYTKSHLPELRKRNSAWIGKKQVEQAGRPRAMACEACNREGKTVFDHDHITGKFRGWLCQPCNKALGFVKDDANRLQLLVDYLTHGVIPTNY